MTMIDGVPQEGQDYTDDAEVEEVPPLDPQGALEDEEFDAAAFLKEGFDFSSQPPAAKPVEPAKAEEPKEAKTVTPEQGTEYSQQLLAAMQKQFENMGQMQSRMQELERQLASRQQGAEAQQAQQQAPRYQPMQLSAEYTNRIFNNENPADAQAALAEVLAFQANQVHNNALAQAERLIEEKLAKVQEDSRQYASQQTASVTQRQVLEQDFGGRYPDLFTAERRLLFKMVASQVVQETGAREWTPQLGDMIARQMQTIIDPSGTQQVRTKELRPAPSVPRMAPSPTPAAPVPPTKPQLTGLPEPYDAASILE